MAFMMLKKLILLKRYESFVSVFLQKNANNKQTFQIYKELKLRKMMSAHIEQKKEEILSRIQGISKLDKAGLSQEFFFKLLENMDSNNIS